MLNPKSLLKVLPVVLLTIVQIVGPMAVARSAEVVVQQPANQNQTINQLIQQLKTGYVETRSSAATAFGRMGESAKSAIPSLIPLLKDSDTDVESLLAKPLETSATTLNRFPEDYLGGGEGWSAPYR